MPWKRIFLDSEGVEVIFNQNWIMDRDESRVPDTFNVTFHRAHDVGGWWIEVPEVPGALSQGANLEEAAVMAIEALKMMCEDD